jgi:hypothetical protein
MCRLDRPRIGPLVEATADSTLVVRLRAGTLWSDRTPPGALSRSRVGDRTKH